MQSFAIQMMYLGLKYLVLPAFVRYVERKVQELENDTSIPIGDDKAKALQKMARKEFYNLRTRTINLAIDVVLVKLFGIQKEEIIPKNME